MAEELMINPKQVVAIAKGGDLSTLLKPLQHEVLLFDSYVAGTSHIKDETILDALKVGDTLWLRREPENRFDANAILVLDGEKRKCGYIPEKDNIVFARLMDAGKCLIAKIVRLEEKRSFRQINISIYLIDY
ncbi:MAG: HIRAN domain-containing protein [Lachnospiraceae bacterium]|nr:HIRAN domain-containing protein [Lachnospiraceae bacterium]